MKSASIRPAGLLLEGEAGIGKSTLWSNAVEQARERGFEVLAARAAAAESVLAYATLADLLSEVDASTWSDLPDPQRVAVDRIMLHGDESDPATDQRAVAAGFLAVVAGIMAKAPVIVAIDDLQWLDPSSVRVVSFAARRLSGRVGVLATVRIGPDVETNASWLQMLRPDAIRRIQVPPLSLGGVNQVVSGRLGYVFPRPTMVRIHEISGGNPFYALELARVIDTEEAGGDAKLPDTLAELVRTRIGSLDDDVRQALLAAACVAAPTVEQVALATGGDECARTQVVLGRLQRRQRRMEAAITTLSEALATFEAMGSRLWAERTAAELARTRFGSRKLAALTPSETRVAELAAKGLTNRDVAAELFVSPKTVEANLSRIYRKLGIHSRAELGRRMKEPDG